MGPGGEGVSDLHRRAPQTGLENAMKIQKAVHIAGIVAGFAAAILMVIIGIVVKKPGISILGGACGAGAIVAIIAGATASPTVSIDPPGVGAKYSQIPDWAFVVIALLLAAAIAVSTIFKLW
jgi:multisubunit Na+/H+ antiporter MnhB subunit